MKNEILIPGMGRLARMVPPGAWFHEVDGHDLLENQVMGNRIHVHASNKKDAVRRASCLIGGDNVAHLAEANQNPFKYYGVVDLGKQNGVQGFMVSPI